MSTLYTGALRIRVLSGSFSRDTEFFSKMAPYVIIRCGNNVKQTSVVKGGGKSPKWNQVNFNHLQFALILITSVGVPI